MFDIICKNSVNTHFSFFTSHFSFLTTHYSFLLILACAILFAALTRAEVIDRFLAPPVVQVDGLVQVRAECNAEMRREFQVPIATYAADICRRLYAAENLKERHFVSPGIAIVIGDVITNLPSVVSRSAVRDDGSKWTKILVPSPGSVDRHRLGLEIVKGYCRAVHAEDLDDDAALLRIRSAYPELKLEDDYRRLNEWYDGKHGDKDDEEFLRLQRSVLQPGVASRHDVIIYASRLYLYPPTFAEKFCGRFDCVSFREAIALAKIDPRIRFAAYRKVQEAMLFASGRGEKMNAAGTAYAAFLDELFRYKKSEAELTSMLDAADEILKGVLE